MEKIECKICGQVIEGYSKDHVEFLLRQHMTRKDHQEKIEEEKQDEKTNKKTEKKTSFD